MQSRTLLRFGWSTLLVWASAGFLLEVLHALKYAPYLDDQITRWLLTLGHAHGVGLSLVVLVYAMAGRPLLGNAPAQALRVERSLLAGALLMPLGFILGAVGRPEGDPSLGITLVPIGALLLLFAIASTARAAWIHDSAAEGQEPPNR